jgi:hypothetical protein
MKQVFIEQAALGPLMSIGDTAIRALINGA